MPTDRERIARLEGLLSSLLEDTRLGATLEGPLPVSDSHMGLRLADGTRYYLAGAIRAVNSAATMTPLADYLLAVPIYIASPIHTDRLSIRVSVAATGNGRLGIYDSSPDFYPSNLIKEMGAFTTGTTGFKNADPSVKVFLSRGLKWLVVVLDATPTINKVPENSIWEILGRGQSLLSFGAGWRVAYTYAALPSMFPVGAVKRQSLPLIFMRTLK